MSQEASDRLAALEAEITALKLEAQARDKAMLEDLNAIRKNLDGIRTLIEVEKKRAKAMDTPPAKPETEDEKLDDEINKKAKTFVNENLERLLDLTRKLLDKVEKEMDEHMKEKTPTPAPQGKEI